VDSLYADRTFVCRAHRIAYRALPGTLVQPARFIYRFLHGKTAL
jgi:hypothetical protein